MPAYDVSAAMPTSKHRRTFHSKPPNVECGGDDAEELAVLGTDEPTPTLNAGLASDGMFKEKAVRRVFSVNEE